MANNACFLNWELVVLASERDDLVIRLHSRNLGEPIRLKPRAGNQPARLPIEAAATNCHELRPFDDAIDRNAEAEFAAELADVPHHSLADLPIAHDPTLGNKESALACDVGLSP